MLVKVLIRRRRRRVKANSTREIIVFENQGKREDGEG